MVINIQDKQSQHKAMSAWDDILVIDDQLSSEEKILKSSVRSYYQEKLLPRIIDCLLYTSPSPRDGILSRMPSSA